MKAEDFEVVDENQDDIRLLLHFTDEQKNTLRKEFTSKSHVVLIEPTLFLNRLLRISKLQNFYIDYNSVQYYQHGVNDEKRLIDYNKNKSDKWFWKDVYYKNQKEFRIVFRNKQIDQGQIVINIGSLSEFALYMTIDELLDQDFILEYSLNQAE